MKSIVKELLDLVRDSSYAIVMLSPNANSGLKPEVQNCMSERENKAGSKQIACSRERIKPIVKEMRVSETE